MLPLSSYGAQRMEKDSLLSEVRDPLPLSVSLSLSHCVCVGITQKVNLLCFSSDEKFLCGCGEVCVPFPLYLSLLSPFPLCLLSVCVVSDVCLFCVFSLSDLCLCVVYVMCRIVFCIFGSLFQVKWCMLSVSLIPFPFFVGCLIRLRVVEQCTISLLEWEIIFQKENFILIPLVFNGISLSLRTLFPREDYPDISPLFLSLLPSNFFTLVPLEMIS